MKWTWAESPKEIDFITSDSPTVQDLEAKFENPMIGPGLRNKHIIVSLPLSPKLCWIGTCNKDMPNHLTIPKLYVKTLNRFRAFYSEQYLYASNYQSALSRLAKKYHGAGLKLSMSGSGSVSGSVDTDSLNQRAPGSFLQNLHRGQTFLTKSKQSMGQVLYFELPFSNMLQACSVPANHPVENTISCAPSHSTVRPNSVNSSWPSTTVRKWFPARSPILLAKLALP